MISETQIFLEAFSQSTPNQNNWSNSQTENSSLCLTEGENMKGIAKRKDGRYMIRQMIKGQRITKYAKTLEEAKIILKKVKNGKFRTNKKQITKSYTLAEYTNEWLELYKKPFLKETTYSDVKSFTNKFVKQLGNEKLKNITSVQIQTYLNGIKTSRTKEKIYIYFNSVLQKAVDTNILLKNPFRAVIKDKKIKCKNNAYTFDEQEKIVAITKGTNIEHEIMIYLMCGCRPNELPSKNQFDFKNNLININGTKNDNALHREVEMSDNFANYIKSYLQNNEVLDEKNIQVKFKELCEHAGIQKPLLYRLRHTFATNHFTLGTPTKFVQCWMGHSSIAITLDTYTDIDKTATKEKIRKLYKNYYFERQ